MNKQQIENTYKMIKEHHEKFLKKYPVQLPKLTNNGNYTKDALCLVFLARGYPKQKRVTKKELTEFIRQFYPDTNDVQQARHLGAQKGWFIQSGTRGDMDSGLKQGEYKLVTLQTHYPKFRHQQEQNLDENAWDSIKRHYNNRCATCGSKENEEHLRYSDQNTTLQKGHKDPNKPLSSTNTIPQCQYCNRADRNNWIYDDNGRVVKVANPRVVLKSSKDVKKEMYLLLKKDLDEK